MTKADMAERDKARETLREFVKPGMTVYTNLRHRARSGMFRVIDVNVIEDNEPRWIGYLAAKATGISYDRNREGLRVSGCGMDMGFHVVYELSRALYPDGFGCIGSGCPSNDHSNGDRDYTKHGAFAPVIAGRDEPLPSGLYPTDQTVTHWHRDGGYALRHRWL
jgi:hypothetical protein